MPEQKNLSEELFQSISREMGYFFVELPREVAEKVRYHIWLMGVFIGSAWIFIRAVGELGLDTWLSPVGVRVFLLSTTGLLAFVSFAFAVLSTTIYGHPFPNHRKLKSMHFEDFGTNLTPPLQTHPTITIPYEW